MAHRHVGLNAVSGRQPGQRKIARDHGGLGNRGLAQIFFGPGDGLGIGGVNEDEFAERLAQDGGQHAIRFGKSFRHDRFDVAEFLKHVHVLRALSGIEECNFGGRPLTAEDALGAQSLPHRRLIGRHCLQRLGRFVRQFSGVGIVDCQTFGRAQIRFSRCGRRRCAACFSRLLHRSQTLGQRSR